VGTEGVWGRGEDKGDGPIGSTIPGEEGKGEGVRGEDESDTLVGGQGLL